ncbi:MAG: hypothetical protein AAGB46_07035 [Verrucomicrobiota bacterium]
MKSLYRLLISWYELSDNALPRWLREKVESDPGLQDTIRLEKSLSAELKHGGDELSREPNPFLKDRILRALDEADRIPESNTSWVKWATVGGAACLAAVVVWNADLSFESEKPGNDIAQIIEIIGDVDREALQSSPNPLGAELNNVILDARGAIGFLASNFVPRSLLEDETVTANPGEA